MEAIDKLMNHFKEIFPKGNWNKVGDEIKERYKKFKSVSGGGQKKRGKSESASVRSSMTYAARAAIRRIMTYGTGRAQTRFGTPQAQEAFNRYINSIIGDVPPGARAQMTLLQRGANMARSTDYTDTRVQENLFNIFCQDYERLDGIRRQERSERHRIDSDNWAHNAFMRYRIFISGLTFAFGVYASYWAFHRFNRPTAVAQELVESVLNIASYRHNQPSPNTEALPSPSPSLEQLQLPCSDDFFTCGYNWATGQPPSQIPEAPAELLELPPPDRTTVQAIGDWIYNTAGSALSSVTSSTKKVGGGLFYVFGSLVDIIEELVDIGAILPGLAVGLITFLFFTLVSIIMLYGISVCGVGIIPPPDPPRGPPGPDKRPPPPPGPSGPKKIPIKPDYSAAMGKKRNTFKFPDKATAGGRKRRKRTKRKRRRTRKKTKRRKRRTRRRRKRRNYTKRQIGCNRRK
jgi:hypothetical protein